MLYNVRFKPVGMGLTRALYLYGCYDDITHEFIDKATGHRYTEAEVITYDTDHIECNIKVTNLEKEPPTSQEKIAEVSEGIKDLLLYKNKQYGDSALHPLCIFSKHIKSVDAETAQILNRIDDKLSRVKNADSLRVNDVSDTIGYCMLLLVKMGVTKEDLAKFKD